MSRFLWFTVYMYVTSRGIGQRCWLSYKVGDKISIACW